MILKGKIHSDIFAGICIAAICLFFYIYGMALPTDAKLFPDILLLLILFLDIFVILEGVRKSRRMSNGETVKDISWNEIKYPLLVFLIVVAYCALFYYAGYFIATPILLIGLMLFFKVRSWKVLILLPVGYLVFTYLLFVWQLNVRLL